MYSTYKITYPKSSCSAKISFGEVKKLRRSFKHRLKLCHLLMQKKSAYLISAPYLEKHVFFQLKNPIFVYMNIPLLYQAIETGKLYHIVSNKTENSKTFIKFKRHDSVFTFICSPSKTEGEEYTHKLLKDGEKARFGTLKVMWDDYEELIGNG